jgi:hypothetical protein
MPNRHALYAETTPASESRLLLLLNRMTVEQLLRKNTKLRRALR